MSEEFEQRLRELRDGYVDRVRDCVDDLEAQIAAIRNGDGEDPLDEIRHILHRLAGSGETLGFPKVSETCAELESRLDGVDADPDAAWLDRLESACEDLRDQVADRPER